MLAFLAARATPGVEVVEQGCYRRSISFKGGNGYFEAVVDEKNHSLAVRVQFGDPSALFFIIERIRAMFDLNADWARIAPYLRSDPVLKRRVDAAPGLRVPGCWDGFELAIRAVLGQQITVKGATALAGRLVKSFGTPLRVDSGLTHLFPAPSVLADANITSIGLTKTRAETIRILAQSVCDGEISFERIVDTAAFLERLREIPGIGKWTAQYIAMRALGETDAFPAGDLGLLRAVDVQNSRELEAHAEAWRPWRAYATMYLWNGAREPTATHGKRALKT